MLLSCLISKDVSTKYFSSEYLLKPKAATKHIKKESEKSQLEVS